MTDNKPALDLMTSIIYEQLFDKSRTDMIKESRPHWHPLSVDMWGDDIDEIMRDHMTVDALKVLGEAEEYCALAYFRHAQVRKLTPEKMAKITKEEARRTRATYGDVVLWQWQAKEKSE